MKIVFEVDDDAMVTAFIEDVPEPGLWQKAALYGLAAEVDRRRDDLLGRRDERSVCPRCGKDVPRKALQCQHCGRTWRVSQATIDSVGELHP